VSENAKWAWVCGTVIIVAYFCAIAASEVYKCN